MAESAQWDWDAIAIGSGLGALGAAAALGRAGKRVLVLERMASFGGAATVYRHGDLTAEAALHETDGTTVNAPRGVFARLGLLDAVEPVETDAFYAVRGGPLPGEIVVPHGLDAAEAAIARALPKSADALAACFREFARLYRSFDDIEAMRWGDRKRLRRSFLSMLGSGRVFDLLGVSGQTLAGRFGAFFRNDELAKCALGGPLGYFDDDPAQLSYLLYAGVWARYCEAGSYYIKGGSAALTKALLKQVTDAGGKTKHHATAVEILTDRGGQAMGVAWKDGKGKRHQATARVVLASPAPETLAGMLPEAQRAAFLKPYASFDRSISLFTVTMGLSRPAAETGVNAYSTFVYPDGMARFADFPAAAAVLGKAPVGRMPPYVLADYGRIDAGLQKKGDPYLVTITGVDRAAWWEGLSEAEEMNRRAAWTEALIADVNRHFPGFEDAVQTAEMATSRTMANRLGTPGGAVYGFRPTPDRLFGRPPSPATPVRGLYLASAWTAAGGYSGALNGGLMAADAVLKPR
jgi:all-trans-retinol 13,14-reductase